MLKTAFLALTVVASLSYAADAPKAVEATGEATIEAGNKPLAKDRAVQNALRNAVEQAAGTLVVSQTKVVGNQLVSDKILSQAKGYVSSYEVLSSSEAGNVLTVRISAKVGTDKLAEDLAAIGLTLSRKGYPRLAVLIAEQRMDDANPLAWWDGKPVSAKGEVAVDQRLAENKLLEEWLKVGFTFVELEALSGKVKQLGVLGADLTREQVRELGNLTQADVILSGTARARKQADTKALLDGISDGADKVQGVSCSATVSVRAFNADNGDTLAAGEATAAAFNLASSGCGRDALVKASKELSGKLQKDLLEAWSKQLSNGGRMQLRVFGIDSIKTLNAFKTALATSVRGVFSVDQKRFEAGTAELDLRFEGSADTLATELDEKQVAKRKLKVTKITNNTIDVELSK